MYDQVTEVKTWPRPNCMRSELTKSCKCFTQQATPMDVTEDICNGIVDDGWFNPYFDEEAARANAEAQAQPAYASRNQSTNDEGQGYRVYNLPQDQQPAIQSYAPPQGYWLGPQGYGQTQPYQPGAAYRQGFLGTAPAQPRRP